MTSLLRGYAAVLILAGIFFSGCGGSFQAGGDVAQGRQALFRGDYAGALSYFQQAAQTDPNYMYGGELREGVLSYLGRAQYLNGQLQAARATLQQSLAQHKGNNLARLYLGLTEARLDDRKAATTDIQGGLKGMGEFLNYIINTFQNSFGSFWDQNGSLRKSIAANQAMISSGNIDWSMLISNLEKLAINYEQVEDIANQDQRQFIEMNQP
jgi:tetratricopeptide (TPR) repeat protein